MRDEIERQRKAMVLTVKKIAIVQSNYIPWKGYFDLIDSVDVFVFYDIVQFTKNDWRNRNKIVVNGQPKWLTIPVRQKELGQKINETEVSDARWATKHWKTLELNYRYCEHFDWLSESIRETYEELEGELMLSKINMAFTKKIAKILGLSTQFRCAEEFDLPSDRQDRLIEICRELNGQAYISGKAAKAYIDEDKFSSNAIDLQWFSYDGYREYPQLGDAFMHEVSILDMLFNVGEKTLDYIRREQA